MLMELELGLALPNTSSIKADFDLNVPDAVDNIAASCCNTDGGGGDDDGSEEMLVVGWPPMRCCSSSRCVKVNMEGMGIGRKVDLSLHDSFLSLFNALYQMFPTQPHGSEQHDQRNYVIKYEHNNGDWMLAGSMPWETFVRTVKRIKILVHDAY